jgi:hypothetical protein
LEVDCPGAQPENFHFLRVDETEAILRFAFLYQHFMVVKFGWTTASGNKNELRNGVIYEVLNYSDPDCPLGAVNPRPSPWEKFYPYCGNADKQWRSDVTKGVLMDSHGDDAPATVSKSLLPGGIDRRYQTFWFNASWLKKPVKLGQFLIEHQMVQKPNDPKWYVKASLYSLNESSGKLRRLWTQFAPQAVY